MTDCYVTSKNLEEKTEKWLETIAPFNTHEMEFDINKSALLIIDMQKFFLNSKSSTFTCGGLAILENIKKLQGFYRKVGRPVIYTKHVHHPQKIDAGILGRWWEGMCVEGSPESEIHEELTPLPREKIILKHRYSAFYNTDLETVLRCQKIK